MSILFALGAAIPFIIYGYLKVKWTDYKANIDYYNAKSLSKDKEPDGYNADWIIYANGTRWLLKDFVTWELYWIPDSYGDDLDAAIKKSNPEFVCTWLPDNKMYKMIKRIIYTHPNLTAPTLYWKIIKFLN